MRHVIVVVGSDEQRRQGFPKVRLLDDEPIRESAWFACANQDKPGVLLDDQRSFVMRLALVPLLAYRLYLLAHNTRLWGGKRPLILVRGRSLASRVAAYAGTWGGGDVVAPAESGASPLGPTRYLLQPDGRLTMCSD